MMKTQGTMQLDGDLKPRILVVGVGGAGGNAVNNMIRSKLEGVQFVAMNTDAQALQHALAPTRIQLGLGVTQGLGAGSKPDVGKAAAEETLEDVIEPFMGANMVFITAGMGGGTGTGAAPVVARAAREMGILTIGVVTKPFHFEGAHRMRMAEQGIAELQQYVDTLIVIPNQNLFRVANERTTFADAFKMADDVLYSGVRGITDLMIMPGLINLDFADVRAVMGEKGKAMMGTGEADGDNRALQASEAAISNPLLDDVSMKGARGVLISITGGYDMTLYEVDEAANRIREEVDPEANIIFGSTFDEKLSGRVRVSIVATGIDAVMPLPLSNSSQANSRFARTEPFLAAVPSQASTQEEVNFFDEEEERDPFFTEEESHDQNGAAMRRDHHLDESQENLPFQGEDSYREPSREKERKLSLFERLTGVGRRGQQERRSQGTSDVMPLKGRQEFAFPEEEDADLLEIPAFLRRQEGK